MSVTVEQALGFVGAGSSDETQLSACLVEAVALLVGYLRHLRQTADGAVTGEVTASWDPDGSTVTWTDTRQLGALDPAGPVPVELLDRATLEVASRLFTMRQAPGGIVNQQYAAGDGTGVGPVRIARDPLQPIYPLLARWAVPF